MDQIDSSITDRYKEGQKDRNTDRQIEIRSLAT